MKQYHVYELFDQSGTIVYVGMTSDPKGRLYGHIKRKPGNHGHGKFYGRVDITLKIYSIYNTKKDALEAEGARKLELGFQWMEIEGPRRGGSIGGKIAGKISGKIAGIKLHSCQYCNLEFKGFGFYQHLKHCKFSPSRQDSLV